MALYSATVEYGLHCLLYLVDLPTGVRASSQELAELQGVSPTYVAKLFTALKTAQLVTATEGAQGGYRLARPAAEISVLDVVHALEGAKPLFHCREIRRQCTLFDRSPPAWATRGPCSIHAVMMEAESRMKEALASHSLADLSARVAHKAPKSFPLEISNWFDQRRARRMRAASASANKGKRS
jgi:Rrf2 family protein